LIFGTPYEATTGGSKAKTWSEAEVIRLFQNTPTPLIADAMDGCNVLGCLKPILRHAAIVGPAVTVKTNPTDWGTVVSAIDVASLATYCLLTVLVPISRCGVV